MITEEREKPYVVGIDVGGQSTKIGVVDRRGNIISQTSITSLYGKGEGTKLIESICETVKSLVNLEDVQGIGIGAPNANYYTGMIEGAVNLEWTIGSSIHFTELISERLNNIKTTITNDANAAAMGEMMYGVARGIKDFIMITLGTGVGSGIVIGGNVVYGHDGFAGELGHTCINVDGRECNCGRIGCLETYTSAIGVSRTAAEWLNNSDSDSLLRDIEGTVSAKDVFDAAEKGDALAIEIFEYTGATLGRAFADFAHFSSPKAFVLFGGLTKAHKYIVPSIATHMNKNLIPMWQNKIDIMVSSLPESDAAILGASALAW